jgi:hypothetical protein
MSSSSIVVIAKLASNFRISAPPAVPVTTISSTSSSPAASWAITVAGDSNAAPMAATSMRNSASTLVTRAMKVFIEFSPVEQTAPARRARRHGFPCVNAL